MSDKPHRWQKGMASPNPKGRPRTGLALAETIRRCVDPQELVDIALGILRDPKVPAAVKGQWWAALADRGWTRPPAQVQVETTNAPTLPAGWNSMPVADRMAFLEAVRARALPVLELEAADEDEGDDG